MYLFFHYLPFCLSVLEIDLPFAMIYAKKNNIHFSHVHYKCVKEKHMSVIKYICYYTIR